MGRLWVRSMWRALWRSDQLDAAMHDEMRFHIDMEAERLIRDLHLDEREARRLAHVAFGGVEKYKEEGRDTRGLRWMDAISLDVRLGARLLIKHRWLTLVGGFAMAMAIAVGATSFEVISEVLNPALPLEEGERVVALQYVTSSPEKPRAQRAARLRRLARRARNGRATGRRFARVQLNLVSESAPPEPIKIAEITASGFDVARTPPLLGRYLQPSDEREGDPAVAVIGHQEWQFRFGGDPHIVGRTLNLGGILHTVVGVMPDGFKFPFDHQFWIPLRVNPLKDERLQGPQLHIVGRLASGVTLEQAQAELTAVAQRTDAAYVETHERIRPIVLPYTRAHLDLTHPRMVWILRMVQLLISSLSFVVAVNLAILVYARTVARLGEIAVRTALGASRRRILAQLFIEALALTVVGAAAGLVLADIALGRIESIIPANGSVPFWLDFELSFGTVIYAFGLAVLAAVVMGVLPGLKATGRSLNANLHELNGRVGARVGPVWTALVIAQIAVAVGVLPVAVFVALEVVRQEVAGPGFAAEEFVVGLVALSDQTSAADSDRVRARQLELMSRLEAEPGVSAVTFSSSIPGFAPDRRIQFEDGAPLREAGARDVSTLNVDVRIFDIYGAKILAGRAFSARDLGVANAVIVNRAFTQAFLENRSALGLRFRYSHAGQQTGAQVNEWYEIVGVVGDYPTFARAPGSGSAPTVYHPAAPGDDHLVALSVRFSGHVPAGFIQRFRKIAAEVDPALQVRRVVSLSEFYHQQRSIWRQLAWTFGLVTTSVLLLSAAGIYALMSFTVTQRTREIGIRAALGAAPYRIFISIFGRVARQLAVGMLVGSLVSGAVLLSIDLSPGLAVGVLMTVAAIMLTVGLLAALGPARRGLRMQASDALRSGQ